MKRLLVAILLACSLFSGCVAIPTSGPVERVELDPERQPEDLVQVVPKPPSRGLSPQQIVGEFIDTMAARQPYRHAALFLSSRTRSSWRPTGVTVVERPDITPVEDRKEQVRYGARNVAHIRADGSWDPSPAGRRYDLTFRLVRENGQWRIDNPPATLLMTSDNVERGFAQYNLYFFDQSSQVLVPDPVYVPLGNGIETRLLNALLRGPTGWLRPATRSALPKGLRLAGPSVTVKGPIATVDLDKKLLDLTTHERERAAAQIAWTLAQVGIEQVRIRVDGVPVTIGGQTETIPDDDFDPALSDRLSQPYAVTDMGRVVQITSGTGLVQDQRFTRNQVAAPRAIAPGLVTARRSPTSDRDEEPDPGPFGLVSRNGRELWLYLGRKPPEKPIYRGADILAPSWDRTDKLWFADQVDGRSQLMVVDEKAEVRKVPLALPDDARLRALSVSRDGARLAAIVRRGKTSSLIVARIDRGDGLAVRDPRTIPMQVPMTSMTDLAWSQVTELAVIGLDESGRSHLVRVQIDGSVQREYDDAPQARQVAAAPGMPILLAGGKDKLLQKPHEEFGWSSLGAARSPAYPG